MVQDVFEKSNIFHMGKNRLNSLTGSQKQTKRYGECAYNYRMGKKPIVSDKNVDGTSA